MLKTLILFMPAFAALFSAAAHAKISSRTEFVTPLSILLVSISAFFFIDACYNVQEASRGLLVEATVLGQLFIPSLLPLTTMYFKYSRASVKNIGSTPEMLWIIIPAILFTSAVTLFLLEGEESIHNLFGDLRANGYAVIEDYQGSALYLFAIINIIGFRAVLTIEMLTFAVYMIRYSIREHFKLSHLRAFLTRGAKIKVSGLQFLYVLPIYFMYLAKFLIIRGAFFESDILKLGYALALTLLILAFSFTALFCSRRAITRAEVKNSFRYNYRTESKDVIIEEMIQGLIEEASPETRLKILEKNKPLKRTGDENDSSTTYPERLESVSRILNTKPERYPEEERLSKFQSIVLNEQLFLRPHLSLDEIAEKLETNRYYVSKMISRVYGMGFPDLINTMRIDYAMQYMKEHPNASQSLLAETCGFPNAPSFNTVFKKITGTTPKMWLATQPRQNK